MIKRFQYSSRYKRKLQAYPKNLKRIIIEEIHVFTEDPFSNSLKTHKLKRKMSGFYSFSVLPDLRIIFRFTRKDRTEVLFHDIGGHEIYK